MSTLMESVKPTELKKFVKSTNSVNMMASRQDQTKQAYECAFKAFVNWCKVTSRSRMPASSETIALYLVSLVQTGSSKSTFNKQIQRIYVPRHYCLLFK